ncbi:MAG: hypothetical protein DRK00_02550 [Thermoprotei archaeon]|nr:MAG: hypothetical protein DRK00_02550 [Thermoprotei archaeon]
MKLEMLPSNLLVVRVWRGRVRPLLLEPEGLPVALAGEILDRFRECLGRSKEEILDSMGDLEELALEAGLDMRVVRALTTLAARAAKFEPLKLSVDPVKARLEIFEEACRESGFTLNEDERRRVLIRVADRLNCSVEELEEVLRRYQEEILVAPPNMSPEELIKEYNLSMVQTLTFKALNLDVRVRARGFQVKKLLRTVKRLGLLYMAEELGDGVRITIDGPASLLRQTRRYGTRLAKLIPYVLQMDEWRIYAKILTRSRVLYFALDDSSSRLFPKKEVEVEPVFDSELEEEFYKSLLRIAPAWRVEREPEPLVVGRHILIPDFSVSSDGRKVYVEIVGFWTKDYLERKLRKLRELKGVRMIVAVDEDLACSTFKTLPHEVVVFRRKLRGVDLYPILRRILGEARRESYEPYIDVEALKGRLPDLSGKTFGEAVEVLKQAGVSERDAAAVLEMLGYRVEWTSLDPRRARVKRVAAR